MGKCPYTWVKGLFRGSSNGKSASELRVQVQKNLMTVVDVSLPARSAKWLIELIPVDVIEKIRQEAIPLQEIQDDLAQREELSPCEIFQLDEPERSVRVWLE